MTQYQEKIVGKPGGLVEPGVKQYGFLKKIFKKVKKVAKSPLGKAALIGGGLYGLNRFGIGCCIVSRKANVLCSNSNFT